VSQQHYGVGHAIGDVAANLGQQIEHYNALPLPKKNLLRASRGAGLITFCIYAAVEFKAATGLPVAGVLPLLQALPSTPPEIWWPAAAWAALLAFGLLWFAVGWRGARGARDVMQAFWALIMLAIYGGLLWWEAYLPPEWVLSNYFLKGLYIAGIVGSLVRFGLSVRGVGGHPVRLVERHIQQTGVTWQTGRRRRF